MHGTQIQNESPATARVSAPGRRPWRVLGRAEQGQSLLEAATIMIAMTMVILYSFDFGYLFITAAALTSAARNAAQTSIMGFQTPAQLSLPLAGPPSLTTTVAGLALADLGALANAAKISTIQVCSKGIGTSGNFSQCAAYTLGSGTTYTTASSIATQADPEAPTFFLNRVDVTYTVQPPVPLSIFGVSLLPNLNFHRYAVMRAED